MKPPCKTGPCFLFDEEKGKCWYWMDEVQCKNSDYALYEGPDYGTLLKKDLDKVRSKNLEINW